MPQSVTALAPTRLDFCGGWTDVQPFCDTVPGLVVNAAFSVYARVRVRPANGVYHHNEFVQAVCRRLELTDVAVELESDAPIGSGLGGSGAVGVALVGALAAFAGKTLTHREIAELAHHIEVEDLGIIGGKQDQFAAAYGGFLALRFLGDTVETQPLSISPQRLSELTAHSVVVYTGQSRVSGSIHAHVQAAYRERNPHTLAALAAIRRISAEFCAALADGPLETLGNLLNENWKSQKLLHSSITNERVEAFFQTALASGAIGGKALGAGGGGCLYFLAEDGQSARLKSALSALGGEILAAGFDMQGLSVIA